MTRNNSALPIQNIKLTNGDGRVTQDWYRYLQDLHQYSGLARQNFPLYEDLTTLGTLMRPDAVAPPTFTVTDNVGAFVFPAAGEVYLHFALQLPHGFVPLTPLYPFVEWAPTTSGTGNVVWVINMAWIDIGSTLPTSSAITITSAAPGTAFELTRQEASAAVTTARKPSSVILCRIYRAGDSGSDTYAANAVLASAGFHFLNAGHGTPKRWPDDT